MQKLKNNEARPKFTGSYKKKRVDFKRVSSFPLKNCLVTRLTEVSL